MNRLFVIAILSGAVSASAARGQSPPAPTDASLRQADALIATHQLEKARELLADIVRQNPANLDAQVELGRVNFALGLNEDAMQAFESALAIQPKLQSALDGEVSAAEADALIDRKAGIDGDALLSLIRARKYVPDSPRLLFDFGMQAEQMRIYHDAEQALATARELAPSDARILYALGRVQFDEQKMPEAEANLRSYLQLKPDDASAHYGLGRLLHMLSRNDEAMRELELSIQLQPTQSESYYELGEIAREQNRDGDAKDGYTKALARAPHHGGALTGMGILALRAKDFQAAEEYLSQATEYAPDYPRAHYYYAQVLARLGHTEESKRQADLAVELDKKESMESRGNQLTVIQ